MSIIPFQFDFMAFPKLHGTNQTQIQKFENKENEKDNETLRIQPRIMMNIGKYIQFAPITTMKKQANLAIPGNFYKCIGDVALIRRICEENGLREHKTE